MKSLQNSREGSKYQANAGQPENANGFMPPAFKISISLPAPPPSENNTQEKGNPPLQLQSMEAVEDRQNETTQPTFENGDNLEVIQRSVTTFVEGVMRGHASPVWEQTRGGTREELNLRLSRERVDAVEFLFQEMFRRAMGGRGRIRFAISCRTQDHGDPSVVSVPVEAVGDRQTIREAGGNTRANEQSMRRVDINIVVTRQIEGEENYTESVTIPEECEADATNQWAIRMAISGGAGHLGIGGAFALGDLKNRRTGQTVRGGFIGGGVGFGLSTPGVTPSFAGGWVNFTSEDVCTFADFDGTLARLTTVGAGAAIIGYSLAWISFPLRGANSIYVGGFNMGSIGADAGTNVGAWNFVDPIPGPPCTPEQTIEIEGSRPYQHEIQNNLHHSVYFDTGSSEINAEQFHLLNGFVQRITAQYSDET